MRVPLFILSFCLWFAPVNSWAIEGYPGSIWGIASYEMLDQNPKTLGYIRQGIDWLEWYELRFSTYTEFRYRFDSEEGEFFNAYAPILGASVRRGNFRLGWEYLWERFPRQGDTEGKSQLYFEWWHGWDLEKR